MELRYRIPYGTMLIHGDTFFREGGKRRVRKVLKDYKASNPPRDEADRLAEWLSGRVREEEGALECLEGLFLKKSRELKTFQAVYEYQKTFCDDKERRRKAKEDLRACKAELRVLSADAGRTRRNLGAYRASLGDMRQILTEEERK